MNTHLYVTFTNTCWMIIAFYWLINAMNTKQTVRSQNRTLRWAYLLALAFSFVLVYAPFYQIGSLRIQVLPQNDLFGIMDCIICAAGVLFAIWARYTLGTNWSGNVTLKKGHELIRSGPYSIVRHPIYTGALIGLLGSACGRVS